MLERIQKLQQLGNTPANSKVTFLVYWCSDEIEKEFLAAC
jgi:hypothetical protein